MTASSLISRMRPRPSTEPREPVARPSSAAAAVTLRAAELGAETGETGRALDSAVVKVEADVRNVANELFVVATVEAFDAEESLIAEQLRFEEAIVKANTDRRMATTTDGSWTAPRVARGAVAVGSGVACIGLVLQAIGLIAATGWMLLVCGSLCVAAAGPELARGAARVRAAINARRSTDRARGRIDVLQEQLRDVTKRRTERDETARRRETWTADTTTLALAELRLQYERGAHARAIVN